MKKIIPFKIVLLAVLLVFTFASCYNKQDDTELADLDITGTFYDTKFDFAQYNTFSIRDSVGLVSDYLTESQVSDFYEEGGANDQILAYWKQAFIDMGYQFVEDSTFDFGVNPVVYIVENTQTLVYGGIWYGGYYGWWGWYPPPVYGPPIVAEVNYKVGTIMIEMADGESVRAYWEWLEGKTPEEIENANPGDIPPVYIRWKALINGVLTNDGKYNAESAERGFKEAIKQSPYLKK